MADELVVTRHGPGETLAMLNEILPVYTAAEAAQMHNRFFWPDQYVDRLKRMYAPSRGFELVVGRIDGKLVGYVFGSPRDNSADVWERVAKELPDIPAPDKPEPIFIFREFQVHPDYQRRGYGRRLHDTLFSTRPEKLAHLLVRKDNMPARAAYFLWGWRKLGEQQPFPDAPTFDELVRGLPLE
jgi:GNAT superfamily N-acetyltransferase